MNYQEEIIKYLEKALASEDFQNDYSTELIYDKKFIRSCAIITHTSGVASGLEIICLVYQLINPKIKIRILKESGCFVSRGDVLATIEGPVRDILRGQNMVVNIIKRMSGIATNTNKYIQEIKSTTCNILSFYDHTLNFGLFENRAVIDGGGYNVIYKKSENVYLSVNHLATLSNLTDAINKLKADNLTKDLTISVEVETRQEFLEAVNSQCDAIFVSSMDEELSELVQINASEKLLVAKGTYSLGKASSIANTGVDYLCIENLISASKPLDIELRFYKGI